MGVLRLWGVCGGQIGDVNEDGMGKDGEGKV